MIQKKDDGTILFFRRSVFEVARLIFNSPTATFHIRQLATLTGVSTTAVSSAIEELRKFSIVTVESTDITTNVKANLTSDAYTFYKRVFNLYRLERYPLIGHLVDTYRPRALVLFGSFAKGEDTEQSDVDVLVLTDEKERTLPENIRNLLEKELKRTINLHVMRSLQGTSPEFKNSVANGIVLHGYLKIV